MAGAQRGHKVGDYAVYEYPDIQHSRPTKCRVTSSYIFPMAFVKVIDSMTSNIY
jgi:hypothetical protein